MITYGKGRNFKVFNNLAFFTLFGLPHEVCPAGGTLTFLCF